MVKLACFAKSCGFLNPCRHMAATAVNGLIAADIPDIVSAMVKVCRSQSTQPHLQEDQAIACWVITISPAKHQIKTPALQASRTLRTAPTKMSKRRILVSYNTACVVLLQLTSHMHHLK